MDILAAQLGALAHESRLGIYRILMRAGREGIAAGEISRRLQIAPTALSFHLHRLQEVGLVRRRRVGRKLIYSGDFTAMRLLVETLGNECCIDGESGCDSECPSGTKARGRGTLEPA